MIVYRVAGSDFDGNDLYEYYTTLREAREAARVMARSAEDDVKREATISREDVNPSLTLALLNRAGYAGSRVELETWRAEPCGRCELCADEMGCEHWSYTRTNLDPRTYAPGHGL